MNTTTGYRGETPMTTFTVVYLWRGDRYHFGAFTSRSEALEALRWFRNDGWQAWIE